MPSRKSNITFNVVTSNGWARCSTYCIYIVQPLAARV